MSLLKLWLIVVPILTFVKIECYERNHLITNVQADGVIVAIPTGTTASSTSTRGSMVASFLYYSEKMNILVEPEV